VAATLLWIQTIANLKQITVVMAPKVDGVHLEAIHIQVHHDPAPILLDIARRTPANSRIVTPFKDIGKPPVSNTKLR
jgi:hypothetical protein